MISQYEQLNNNFASTEVFYTYYSSKVPSFSAYNQNKKKNVTGVQMLAVESQWVKIFSWHVDSLILLFPVGRGSWWSRLPAAQMLSGSGERASGRVQKQTQPLQMSAWSVALGSILKKKKTQHVCRFYKKRDLLGHVSPAVKPPVEGGHFPGLYRIILTQLYLVHRAPRHA